MTDKQFSRLTVLDLNEETIYMPAPDRLSDIYLETKYVFRVIAKESLYNEDYKTAIAREQGLIPKNTELEVQPFSNLYGNYLKTYYNGSLYYIDYSKVELVEIKKLKIRTENFWNGNTETNVDAEEIEI